MRKYTKEVFINNNILSFSPRGCRPASTSKGRAINVNVNDIVRRGC